MVNVEEQPYFLLQDQRFHRAIELFNSASWYSAHDVFEELWHETGEPERITIQGILQVAVAQLHLERGNKNGARILYGEGLGRLRREGIPSLGIDIRKLCDCVEERLVLLQKDQDTDSCKVPFLSRMDLSQ